MAQSHKALALVSVLSALALTACESTAGTNSDGSINLVNDGQLTVCTNPPYKPFEFEEGGKIVGFDADIARAIADDMGVELNMASTGFEGIDSAASLITGQCDIAFSGITVTEERKSKMDFTIPYLDDNLALLVPADSEITGVDQLAGVRTGAQQATSGEDYATEAGADVVQYEDAALMLSSLQTGQVDAVVANISIVSAALAEDDSLKLATEIETGEQIAGTVSTANPAMLEQANKTIQELKDTGELSRLQEQWLGLDNEQK